MAAAVRSRFRIHLSTAIVLMFVASGLLWANLQPRETRYFDKAEGVLKSDSYGFPSRTQHYSYTIYLDSEEAAQAKAVPVIPILKWYAVIVNTLFAGVVLLMCAVLNEWRIRRREAP